VAEVSLAPGPINASGHLWQSGNSRGIVVIASSLTYLDLKFVKRIKYFFLFKMFLLPSNLPPPGLC
jgi:hypothetical protein